VTSRATARHRAPLRPATPLSTVAAAVSGGVNQVGRGSVVAAMSTGLIATFGLPGSQSALASAATTTPSASTQAATRAAADLALSASLSAPQTPVTAPATAKLSLVGGSAFTAVPKATPKPTTTKTATASGPRATTTSRSSERSTAPASPPGSARGASVISVAARYVGVPYVYGGTTPDGFDCSGYVKYVFAAVGISLPRTADQQMNATTRISSSEAQPGDLVFFVSGGRAYHNGIYAGNGMIYDSPKSGGYVSKRAIWSATVVYTRVTG
jgi:peptidoglycan DL-endopeptidase CwlO